MYLKNKDNNDGNKSRSQKYVEMESSYYMALACDGDFIAYTNKEPPVFKFVRELVKDYKQNLGNVDPAGYIEFSLDRKNPADLPQTSIKKIKLTGGVSEEYPNGSIKLIKDSIPARTASCPVPEFPRELQRRRSSSDGSKDVSKTPPLENQNSFFAQSRKPEVPEQTGIEKYQEVFKTPPSENQHGLFAQSGGLKVPKHTPSINEIMKDVAESRHQDALQKLVALPNTVSPTIKSELISQIQELIKVREGSVLAEFYKKILPYAVDSDIPALCCTGLGNNQ
jgi:hypothetical protein